MMTLDTYNGWKNRETWLVNLWLTNEQGPYSTLVEIAESDYELFQKSDLLQQFVYELCMGDDWSGSTISNGLVCDLVNQSLYNVDYREIISGIIE